MILSDIEKKTHAWMEQHADSWQAQVLLSVVAFLEASVVPLPPSMLLLAMVALGDRRRWLYLATLTTLASVLGGLFGYFIGAVLYDTLGRWIIEHYGLMREIAKLGMLFERHALLANFTGAFTPIPYKAFTIASGFFSINILIFTFASILGRGLRFFVLAYLAKVYGEHLSHTVIRYATFLTLLAIVLAGVFVMLLSL